MKSPHFNLLVFLLVYLLFISCKDQGFIKTKNATLKNHSLNSSSIVNIQSYKLTYNPKANGFIKLSLESGAVYEAKSVDGGSFSSINLLLNETGVQFDTTRKELVIDKLVNNKLSK